ncbi:hypothetical protein ABZT03_04025 [Streptomyces sp. NPDC005574]|uniref:hypothetical protein n=1 Tax=Streptomyces sp. NPDC005574 TaxID=3156891 RepID=UPI0033A04669
MPADEVTHGTDVDASRVRTGPRHAAPRKPLFTRFHVPAGKAIALAAMPTAVLMGMGFTPTLANADDQPASNSKLADEFKDCVATMTDDASASASPSPSDSASDDASESPDKGDTAEPTPSATPSAGATDPGKDSSSDSGSDDKADPTPSASESKSTSSGGSDTATPTPAASETSKNILDTIGDTIGDILIGGDKSATESASASPTPSASESAGEDTPTGSSDAAKETKETTDKVTDTVKNTVKDTTGTASKAAEDTTKTAEDTAAAATASPSPSASASSTAKADDCEAASDDTGAVDNTILLPDDPWYLNASSLTLNGADYQGIVKVRTASGKVKEVLKYVISGGTKIVDLHQTVKDEQSGKTYHVQSAKGKESTIEGGKTVMYTESISGNLFGLIPLTFSVKSPPPLNIPYIVFTNVKVQQAGQFGGTLTIPGLHQYID